ncbi:MAG: membrane dipeptidase [Planctomycetes bacterium]|nr:membrane dipeptidase [Planctomycetota bacterium]MCB9936545.1 membrane dipeptidase [Planctomycetota bacterium]
MRYADAHADTFYRITLEQLDPFQREGGLHVNLPRTRDVGQVLQVCSVFTPARYSGKGAEDFARRIIATLDHWAHQRPDAFLRVRNRADLARLGGGALGLIPWLEGASPLRGELSLLDEFFALGVRGIGLVHNHANEVADGCGVAEPRKGLSEFGRGLIARMEALGMAVDCAHLPQPAFNDVMAAVTRPPCISHVGARGLVDIVRNADDAMLRAVAERGGFVGIDFYPGHVLAGAFEPGVREATVADVADHLLHAIKVCGLGQVGLGGDFDGFNDACEDLRHVGDMPNLERELASRGLPDSAIEKLFSANLLRYLGEVLP